MNYFQPFFSAFFWSCLFANNSQRLENREKNDELENDSEEIRMGRGIPIHYSETLDGLLNNQYENIDANIIFPPLALALNDQNSSLTRKKNPQNFEG